MSKLKANTLKEWQEHISLNADNIEVLLRSFIDHLAKDDVTWIYIAPQQQICDQLNILLPIYQHAPQTLPLFGIPFAVKDNIDVAGWQTTAACPAFAYSTHTDATAITKLKAAGAIVVGKINLDQFATGLVGVRSPYGKVTNSFNSDYVSRSSSSGSASVVARGLVPFSLGTDTAGSGRVPAGLII